MIMFLYLDELGFIEINEVNKDKLNNWSNMGGTYISANSIDHLLIEHYNLKEKEIIRFSKNGNVSCIQNINGKIVTRGNKDTIMGYTKEDISDRISCLDRVFLLNYTNARLDSHIYMGEDWENRFIELGLMVSDPDNLNVVSKAMLGRVVL